MNNNTTQMNMNELKAEILENVAGGDQKHYLELVDHAASFAKECIENNLSAQYYQAEMKKVIDQYIEKGMLEGTEPANLWTIVEFYSHKIR